MQEYNFPEVLQKQEERFKTLIQNINGYVYSIIYEDNKAVASYHSPKCELITGYTPDEYAADHDLWLKMVFEKDKQRVLAVFSDLIHLEQSQIDHRIVRKDGRVVWISNTFTPEFSQAGEIKRLDGFIFDITQRKDTEDELRRFRDHLQELVDGRTAEIQKTNEQLQREIFVRKKIEEELREYREQLERLVEERTLELKTINRKLGQEIIERRQAEEALKEQYVFLQNLIDTIPYPIFFKDSKGVHKGCNIAFEKFCCLKKEEIIGKDIRSITSEEIADIFSRLDTELLEKPGIMTYESELSFNGSGKNVIFNKATYFNPDLSLGGIAGVIIDISEIKKIQLELQNVLIELREMEKIVNRSPAVVFLWKAEKGWPIEYVSDNISQFGYSSEDFMSGSLNYSDIIHPDDLERIIEEINYYTVNNIQEFSQEYRIIDKSGKVFWLDDRTWVRTNDAGAITHFQGLIIDITKRKEASQALKDSEERYRTLAENSYDLISELSSEFKFLYLSPNFKEILGYDLDEVINKEIFDFIHPDDFSKVIREIRKDIGSAVCRYRHKNGEWIWFESTGKKFTTSEGETRGVIVSRDITERKRLEKQLILSEKLMAIGEMSAMIAHEFRNALTSVKMILQLYLETPELDSNSKRSFNVAVNSIYHMERIVGQLLNISHPASLEFKEEDLNKIVKECFPFLEMQALKHGIKVKLNLDNVLPNIKLNSGSFKEAIINLMINSTQAFGNLFQPEKKIFVTTKLIKLRETLRDFDFSVKTDLYGINNLKRSKEILIPEGSSCAVIEISDNGPGIKSEALQHIFEPFFTTKEKGSGLGLSVVKKTVNAHGGVVTVESIKNEGTTFRIILPLKYSDKQEEKIYK